jgi:hypothetical protein
MMVKTAHRRVARMVHYDRAAPHFKAGSSAALYAASCNTPTADNMRFHKQILRARIICCRTQNCIANRARPPGRATRMTLLMGSPMYTEHTHRDHGAPRAASAVDRSNPLSPRRLIAQDIILSRRRLRQHVAVAASLGVCLATLLLAFE